jgi:hypothetical protein
VRVHDIVLPFDFDAPNVGALYSENRMLAALIAGSGRYEVVAPLHTAALADAEAAIDTRQHSGAALGSFWRPQQGSPLSGTALHNCPRMGSSFWLRVKTGHE